MILSQTVHCSNPILRHLSFTCLAAILLTLIGFTDSIPAIEKDLPFHPGEKLTFQLKWEFIPAGEAVLEVLPIETIGGIKSFHFVLTVKTNKFLDLFYKVRNRIDSYTDIEMTHSILFKQQKHEGRTRRNIVVNFNWGKNEAQYSNFSQKIKPISIRQGSFDPLSVFYYSRLIDLKENAEIRCPVTDGKKSILGKAKVLKQENVKLAGKTYDTFLFEPELKDIGGVFEKSKDAKIKLWVTADKRRIPVKIKSKVVVGNFVGELISATGVDD